jgi:catechol 2,3-dioxygenase-like lactoylglutathione lyase family enzyme
MERSSVTIIVVPPAQLPAAIDFYRHAFDMDLSEATDLSARLTGAGFTIWLHAGEPGGFAVQEFTARDADPVGRLRALGCTPLPIGDGTDAVVLRDPYGLVFHVR